MTKTTLRYAVPAALTTALLSLLAMSIAGQQQPQATPIPWLAQPFLNAAGTAPLANGKVYTYLAGTSTPSATYTTSLAGPTLTPGKTFVSLALLSMLAPQMPLRKSPSWKCYLVQ